MGKSEIKKRYQEIGLSIVRESNWQIILVTALLVGMILCSFLFDCGVR